MNTKTTKAADMFAWGSKATVSMWCQIIYVWVLLILHWTAVIETVICATQQHSVNFKSHLEMFLNTLNTLMLCPTSAANQYCAAAGVCLKSDKAVPSSGKYWTCQYVYMNHCPHIYCHRLYRKKTACCSYPKWVNCAPWLPAFQCVRLSTNIPYNDYNDCC